MQLRVGEGIQKEAVEQTHRLRSGRIKKNTRLKPLRKQGPITQRLLFMLHSGDGCLLEFTLANAGAGTAVLY
ncbi:MAG: hypothetical protein EBQ89_06825 [Alphaproteobacteria bacterium]|nr:hypothetical protein [Alphaproteobacteria bacterium]